MMRPDEFQFLSQIVKQRSGLVMGEDQSALLESRLLPIARSQSMQDMGQLCGAIKSKPSENLLAEMVEAVAANDTLFFREPGVYQKMRNVLFPQVIAKQPGKHMRIWSAACSTGQEPYSIAMCIQEEIAKMPNWRFEILGTDISRRAVDKAQLGIYSQFDAQRGMPIRLLVKYLNARPDGTWQIKDDLRTMVNFRTQNLLEEYASFGRFDIVFMRYVLGAFDEATRSQITEKIYRVLYPHGTVILGAGEKLTDPNSRFRPLENFSGAFVLK